MSGAMFEVESNRSWGKRLCVVVLCASATLLGTTAFADSDKHRGEGKRFRGDYSRHDDRRYDRHDNRRHDRRDDRRSYWRDDHRDDRRHYGNRHDDRGHYDQRYRGGPGWRYHSGRYWAPASYRGSYCNDRRHYHGAHYHVAARDYYDYYYPRYSYHGARPYGANASVIISIPLF